MKTDRVTGVYQVRIHVAHFTSSSLFTFSFRSCSSWHYPVSPERISLLPIAHGVNFATAVALRRMDTFTGATLAYIFSSEVKAMLFYMPDLRHYMLFSTFWNTGVRIGESRTLTPESFDLDGLRPFVKIPGSGHPA